LQIYQLTVRSIQGSLTHNYQVQVDVSTNNTSVLIPILFTFLFKLVFLGISNRDSSFDVMLNSMDCIIGPGTDLLKDYKLLLRSDVDTVPTPYLLGYWPEQVVVNRFYGTTHGSKIVERILRDTALAAGLEHMGWYNMGSSWYGDGQRIINMAKLTVALYKFAKWVTISLF
jgi:hypothetical protein